ncbi:MAG: hypothetical protein IJZ72_05635 [Oscillospiraceae bacterium]|nr:hypothetical protein [Oscillospiraceae bacterium]
MAKEKKKKKGGAVILVLLLLIIIALVLLYFFGGGLGLGFGGGLGLGEGDSVAVNATVTAEQTAEQTASENAVIVIEINDGKIIFDGTEYATYEEFEKFFYENDFNGQQFILRDNMAVKSAYDSVKALLDSFGGNYSEETV